MDRFTADDGTGIAYRTWGDGNPGRPLLLHHGFLVDGAINWEATGVVAALVESGHRVVAPDARGHGASDKPHDPARYGHRRMALDLGNLIDHLGFDAVSLAGYSMGAVVALNAATLDARIQRLAVGGVGGSVVDLGGPDTRVLDTVALAAALRTDDISSITHQEAKAFRQAADMFGNDLEALACHAESARGDQIPLATISVPTLVFAGEADHLARGADRLAAAIPGARFVEVAGDHMTAFGEDTIALLVDFFADRPS